MGDTLGLASVFGVRSMKHPALLTLLLLALTGHLLQAQKLQVYVLVGQSNMQGQAKVETLDYLADDPETAKLLQELRDAEGKARVFDKVWISYLTGTRNHNGEAHGKLTTGYGARRNPAKDDGKIGPELGFGLRIAKASKGPVLLIKCAWGGKSLHTDFRPPSAGPYPWSDAQLARMKKKKLGKIKKDKIAATGRYYRYVVDYVREVLRDPSAIMPSYNADKGYELAGFVWFQGWNDMVDPGTYPQRDKPGGYAAYSQCLVQFIQDLRKDLKAPKLPFVIGVMGVGGRIRPDEAKKRAVHKEFRAAMTAPAELPEFRGNVVAVPTDPYWDEKLAAIVDKFGKVRNMARMLRRKHPKSANADGKMTGKEIRKYLDEYRAKLVSPEELALYQRGASNAAYHYLGSAKTMLQIGQAFADALIELRKSDPVRGK